MKRKVLAIPIGQIRKHFETNTRQDIKIVAPEILSEETYNRLVKKGKHPEKEVPLETVSWEHSPSGKPNLIVEAKNFIEKVLPQYADGPFCLAFANEKAIQDEHHHQQHLELYYSEARLTARYRYLESTTEEEPIELPDGGIIVFGPGVVHSVELGGLTIVLEFPAVANDKKDEKITKST